MKKTKPLTDLQLELIKLFRYDMNEEQLLEIKSILSKYFAQKIDVEFEKFEKDNELSTNDYSKWAYEHLRAKGE